jgi:hypothetical protein
MIALEYQKIFILIQDLFLEEVHQKCRFLLVWMMKLANTVELNNYHSEQVIFPLFSWICSWGYSQDTCHQ